MESLDNKTRITIQNELELSSKQTYRDLREKRLQLIPSIKEFIAQHSRFSRKDVSVTFALSGVSSFVSILETENEKLAFKIPLGRIDAEHEVEFLNIWETVGVHVPHVIETGQFGNYSYILMNFVDAPVLSEKFNKKELIENKKYYEMGETLRLMHKPQARGYGNLMVGQEPYQNFEEWIDNDYIQNKLKYVQENRLLTKEHGSLESALKTLVNHVHKDTSISYCHGDFSAPNIFATEPLTVFDPNPTVNNKYIDLGRALVLSLVDGGNKEAYDQFLEGYFKSEDYDTEVLHAAVLFNAYYKFQYWHKKEKTERIRAIQEQLRRGL